MIHSIGFLEKHDPFYIYIYICHLGQTTYPTNIASLIDCCITCHAHLRRMLIETHLKIIDKNQCREREREEKL